MQPPDYLPGDLPDVVDPSDADHSGVQVQDMLMDTLRALLNAARGTVHLLGK